MSSLNKVMLIGNLGGDPELRYTQNQRPVCNFSMATTKNFKDAQGNRQSKTEWHKIVVWGLKAENVSKYLKKGSKAYVEGELETRKWTDDKQIERYTTEVNAFQVTFLDRKEDGGQQPQGLANQDFSVPEEDLPF